mgnify:CR=1 FL=1
MRKNEMGEIGRTDRSRYHKIRRVLADEYVSDDRLKISKISQMFKNENEISFDGDLLDNIKNFFLASNGYVSYAGTFNADNSNVYHNVELSLLPQWVDTTLTREYSFSSKNTLLTLSAEFNGFKDLLVWKKV